MHRGFTLIEAMIILAVVGFGVVGLLELLGAGSMANIESNELTTAVFLASNVNELLQGASYGTLHSSYDNVTYSPPKDASGANLTGFNGWSQVIDVSYVDPDLVTSVLPDSDPRVTSMVTVQILHNAKKVYTLKWVVAAPS